jgi:Tol biopolymer transport system component
MALGDESDWSPDGTRIAFTRWDNYCDYYYYYYCYLNPVGLAVAATEGTDVAELTTDPSDNDATWRPDGTQIAFTRWQVDKRLLFLMNADGSAPAPVTLPTEVRVVSHPVWSPDGGTIAFTCEVETGNSDVCLVNADGTGFLRLTSDAARDARPAWKPDGSLIAFTTNTFGITEIAVMAPDGGGVTRLSPGTGAMQPAWSRDGATIAFAGFTCDIYTGCLARGLFRMNADGTGVTPLTTNTRDRAPAWRP